MELAQVPSEIVGEPEEYMTYVHGEAGTGKTTWLAGAEGHYIAQTERGTKGVQVYGSDVSSWEEFIELCKALKEAKENNWGGQREVRVIGIDTYDMLYAYGGDWVCRNTKFIDKGVSKSYDRIEDVPWGRGYRRTSDLLITTLNKLHHVGFGLILLGHTQGRMVQWRGQEMTKWGLGLSPTANDAIVAACDAVAYFCIEEENEKERGSGDIVTVSQKRLMYWQPQFLRVAKHRLRGFPELLEVDRETGWDDYSRTFKETYQNEVN